MSSSEFSEIEIEEIGYLADSPPSSPRTRATTHLFNNRLVDMTPPLMPSASKLSNAGISSDGKVNNQPVKPIATSEHINSAPSFLSAYRRHERFYFDDGNITFLVEDMLYNVHRYFFCRDSSYLVNLISNRLTRSGSDPSIFSEPFILSDVKSAEFDALLCILYPLDFNEWEINTVGEWASVLRLATDWSLWSIRTLAISCLEPIASPVDKIVLGRTYSVDAWLLPGFVAICQRSQPLTKDEGRRLGVDDAVLVACLRESVYACSTKVKAVDISAIVQACFLSPEMADKGLIPLISKAPLSKGSQVTSAPNPEQSGSTKTPLSLSIKAMGSDAGSKNNSSDELVELDTVQMNHAEATPAVAAAEKPKTYATQELLAEGEAGTAAAEATMTGEDAEVKTKEHLKLDTATGAPAGPMGGNGASQLAESADESEHNTPRPLSKNAKKRLKKMNVKCQCPCVCKGA